MPFFSLPCPRRQRRGLGALAIAMGSLALVAPTASARAKSGPRLHINTVCFTVHNGDDPQASTLYGLRYVVGHATRRTPAIVLVHGVASSTANWDFSPRWSVARSLARAGYVVISYDRLGFAKSVYPRPNGGRLITTLNQRDMLHQVVGEVKSARYAVSRGSTCSAPTHRSRLANRRVVIVGHSAGGGIVEGYPGRYHDVAAMVQADWSNQPPLSGTTPPPSPENQYVAQQLAAGKDYVQFFRNVAQCVDFNIYPPGAVWRVVRIACHPGSLLATPAGEFLGFGALVQQTNTDIKHTSPATPILLTWGNHDSIFGPDTAAADYKYWVDNCPACDVTAYFLPRTGHLFMAHQSLPDWLREVTGWLASRGIRGRRV